MIKLLKWESWEPEMASCDNIFCDWAILTVGFPLFFGMLFPASMITLYIVLAGMAFSFWRGYVRFWRNVRKIEDWKKDKADD